MNKTTQFTGMPHMERKTKTQKTRFNFKLVIDLNSSVINITLNIHTQNKRQRLLC